MMKRFSILGVMFSVLAAASCASMKNEPVTLISPYNAAQPVGLSALVYGLPQTRLFFDVDMVRTFVKKGPYAEYANRLLGLQNVTMKDSESWHINAIYVRDRQEVDSKHLYSVSFTDYPQNLDKLLRFTNEGLLLDLNVGNVLINNQYTGKMSADFRFINTAVTSNLVVKVDTMYNQAPTDTEFVHIPVLTTKVMHKTIEEQAGEAAQLIFDIRKWRTEIIRGDVDNPPADGEAFRLVLQTLDKQEEQLLSLFIGVKYESRQTVTYNVLPEKPETKIELFHFSENSGIVSKSTAGAKPVWFATGKASTPVSITLFQQGKNIIYYRIPQIVEITAGYDINTMISEQVTICQFGNLVSFPLAPPPKK